MPHRRGDRVPPVEVASPWTVVFGNRAAARAWGELRRTNLKKRLDRLSKQLQADPRWAGSPRRHKHLKPPLAFQQHDGFRCEVWQHRISDAGRVRFLIHDPDRTVFVIQASAGHPKDTE